MNMPIDVHMEFEVYKDSYQDEVQRAISFVGQNLEFFTQSKAQRIVKTCEKYFSATNTLSVLNVGCGVGLLESFLEPYFKNVYGVDVTPGVIETAQEANPRVKYQTYDGKRLPFSDASFDVVFAVNVLHHVPPNLWVDTLKEMYRVATSGAVVIIFEHNPVNPLTQIAVSRCEFDRNAVLLGSKTAQNIFKRAGLNVLERKYVTFFPWRGQIFSKIESLLHWLPLGAQYYLVGRK